MYNIKPSDLDKVDFKCFHGIVDRNDPEFYSKHGREHYKLLTYFSTQFNNCNILDIGTHKGHSALALSYNKTNTVYTFDIVDNVNPNVKLVNNIKFVYDDLFKDEGRQKWKDVIMSCPFIFLDVDPHNGHMEIDFMRFIQEIGYNGFVICDDIWYFKEMRDNFWYKIEDKYRYDLTDIGHWSGTGIITFNKDITFPKYDVSNWTLVTAYFNLTKCPDASIEIKNRDQNYYLHHSISTLSLPHNLVIYCDNDSIELIRNIRPKHLEEKTKYIICEFDDFQFKKNNSYLEEKFKDYRIQISKNRQEKPYYFDNRNTASYYLFCMSRYAMLKETIETNPFKSTHFSWINFCIERMGFRNLIRLDEGLSINRDKFSTCYIDYIPECLISNLPEYFQYGRCSMCSGFFTGNAEYMYKVCDLIEDKFLEYLSKGYGHADEQLYSPVYFSNPSLFEHYYGDYQEMITNYRYIYDRPEPPIYNFITRSFDNQNYKLCYEACKFVLSSVLLDKCILNNDYTGKLLYYFSECKQKLNI
jgi:hypothetical protein